MTVVILVSDEENETLTARIGGIVMLCQLVIAWFNLMATNKATNNKQPLTECRVTRPTLGIKITFCPISAAKKRACLQKTS